ncbi:MAG: SIS domain-containing protein [Nanoarchaeota archaeon]|nr:SIS domain-containing protein [Nanoarchaeota archaeon]
MGSNLNEYLKSIMSKFNLIQIKEILSNIEKLNVLIIGDIIIDEYCFVDPRGGAIKDPMLTVDYFNEEIYAGGILAIANHISSFAKEVKVVTLIGDQMNYKDHIINSLNENVKQKIFVKTNSPTTRKRRYINQLRGEKIFMVEYLNDLPINQELETEIVDFLEQEIQLYDLVIVGDFGHGFINEKIIKIIEEKAKYLAVNVQTNSANLGFNYVTKYHSPSFLSMDVPEIKFATGDKHSEVPVLIDKLQLISGFNNFLVTLGRRGVAYFKDGKIYQGPVLSTNVTDIVGAGDAVFSVISLLSCFGCDPEFIPFIANCVGGVAVSIMGNKESVTKEKLIEFISKQFKESEEENINDYFSGIHSALENLNKGDVNSFVKLILKTYQNQGTIYTFGNGGSGATASHFCCDLIQGASRGLEKRFRSICLNDNTPALLAIANDISYDDVFIEQLKNFLKPGDLVIGFSGSGNSNNVVKALEYAKKAGVKTLAVCGFKGGKIKEIADLAIHAKIDDMEIAEDIHSLIVSHCVKRVLMQELGNIPPEEISLKQTTLTD